MSVRVVASCIHKGGTGKTTCAVHLVHRLQKLGRRVMLIDCDTQGNATSAFLEDRPHTRGASRLFERGGADVDVYEGEAGVYVIPADDELTDIEKAPVGAETVFRNNVRAAARDAGVDDVVIDTPPTIGFGMLAPLVAADFAFSPIVADPYSLDGVDSLLRRVRQVQDAGNPKLKHLGLLVNRLNRNSKDQLDAAALIEKNFKRHLIPHFIGERASIARVAFTGEPVWAGKGGAAGQGAREMRRALDWIINEMGGV